MDILTTRQQEIVSILNEKEQLSVNDLAEHFSVTPATIRRELTLLAAKGIVIRKHGYTCLNNQAKKDRSSFNIRLALNGEEKKPLSIAVEELRTGGFKILSEESENYENYEDEPLA